MEIGLFCQCSSIYDMKRKFLKKKARYEPCQCPSGNREHGWEGNMLPVLLLSSIGAKILNKFKKKLAFF